MSNVTIFEKILKGTVKAEVVYENEHVLSFHDIDPQAPVHVLVIPRIKITGLNDVKTSRLAILGHFFQGIALTAEALGLEENGYRVVMNNGKDACQTVDYLHAHIIAGRKMTWPPG